MLSFFLLQVEQEGKPMTNQKSSGRCWIFALLNVARIPFMKKYHLEEFEFSQTHLFFYDKVNPLSLSFGVKELNNQEKLGQIFICYYLTYKTL